MSIEARLRPAHRMLRRLQRVGAQANSKARCTPSLTANWLEVAAGRLEAWKGSSARAGARRALEFVKAWYPGLDLDRLATLRLEAQPELAAAEDALVKRAAAIPSTPTPASSSPSGLKTARRYRRSGLG